MKYKMIDGKQVPVLPARAVEIVKHKKTGKVYASKEEFDKDVADPKTSTTKEDFRQDLEVTVASLSVVGKTK